MGPLDRRRFLALSTGVLSTSVVGMTAACAGQGSAGTGGSGTVRTLRWWDHTTGNKELLAPIFQKYTKASGVKVEYTYYQAGRMGQALQLARSSHQLPDVHSIAGLQEPLSQLVADGWFQPLQLSDEEKKKIPAGSTMDGLNVFDGKLYSFPIHGSRYFNANLWFNKSLVSKVGLDPEAPPTTFEEFRAACAQIKRAGEQPKGLILNTGATLEVLIDNLAQSAGFEGSSGTLFRTGEVQWHADPYVAACEFIVSLYRDRYVVQGTFTSDTARPRWMAGQAAYMIDGIWIPGAVKTEQESFLDQVGVGGPLTDRPGQQPVMYREASPGSYFVSKASDMPKQASAVIALLLTDDYQVAQVRQMTQAPLRVELLDDPQVHPSFRAPLKLAQERCFLMPELARKDTELAAVMARVPPTKPGIADIVEGLIAGKITDVRGALKELSDKDSAARDAALKKAGHDASELAFPNWQPEKDYTDEMYDA